MTRLLFLLLDRLFWCLTTFISLVLFCVEYNEPEFYIAAIVTFIYVLYLFRQFILFISDLTQDDNHMDEEN